MAQEIKTEILIHATPAQVWAKLMDFLNYPKWNPFIRSIRGEAQIGQRIEALIQPPGGKAMTFRPKVLALTPHQEFRWLGHLFIPGLFDGEHKFELRDNQNGTTTLFHSEQFSGLLVPVFQRQLADGTRKGFEAMNQKLKELVEVKTA
jgi:hypothetical protein